jgi:hypothetical protein
MLLSIVDITRTSQFEGEPVGGKSTFAATVVSWALGIAGGLLILALVLLAFLVMALPFTGDRFSMEVDNSLIGLGSHATVPVRFYVDADAHRIEAPSIGVSRAELQDTHGRLRFPAPKGYFLFVNIAFLFSLLLLALMGLRQLHAVFGTLRNGRPFIHANARRLRLVAGAVIAGELLGAAMVAFNQFYAKAHFTATGLLFDWSFNVDPVAIVLAFIILAIAEVFAAGSRLDEDQALTI